MSELKRRSQYEIAPLFMERWSPRSFTDEIIPDHVLFKCFEAARWAPSSFNLQPWRFIYSEREEDTFSKFVSVLSSTNQLWAANAAALILFVSKNVTVWEGHNVPSLTHSFDTGAAWSNFAHQAKLLGWHTHAMAGFDRDRARIAFEVPKEFSLEVMVAIGRIGAKDTLPEKLQAGEFPSDRLPLTALIMKGGFNDS